MTAKITLTWDNGSSEHVDQIVYRSAETFTVDNLPTALARVGRNAREYTDTDIVTGNVYFYAVASENAEGEILLSSVISVTAETSTGDPHWDKVVALLQPLAIDEPPTDATGRTWSCPTPIVIEHSSFPSGHAFEITSSNNVLTHSGGYGDFDFLHQLTESWTMDVWMQGLGSGISIIFANNMTTLSTNGVAAYYLTNNTFQTAVTRSSSGNSAYLFKGSDSGSAFPDKSAPRLLSMQYNLLDDHFSVYVDGDLVDHRVRTGSNSSTTAARALTIGGSILSSWGVLVGEGVRIGAFRVTKDVARYTENFTPPTEPFPNF